MEDKNLDKLKREYMNTPIPKELDFYVKKALKESGVSILQRKNKFRITGIAAASIIAAVTILTVGINTNQAFAKTLSEVPIVGSIVKVLTFKEYTINDGTFNANIKIPAIDGLENKKLESSLNEKYLAENKMLYDRFVADMKDLKEKDGGHLGVNSGYVIKTDTDRILSVGRYVVNTVGSSSTTFKFDTIDRKKEVLITLPSLFKDDSFIGVLSENIKEQMREQHKSDNNKIYWVEGIPLQANIGLFEKISMNQNFYINAADKLVISFNKYEVAPGYMGVVEFVIPTEAISDILAGNEYIK